MAHPTPGTTMKTAGRLLVLLALSGVLWVAVGALVGWIVA